MPRPKNKKELLLLSQEHFERLMDLINNHSEEAQQRTFPEGTLNRNIRDVLAHLYHWHLMMLEWYSIGMNGQKPDMPAKGYSWKDTSELNRKIREQYKQMDLSEAKQKLKQSHVAVRKIITKHTDEELFQKKRYPWTGTTSLGAYLVSSTSSHYDWAFKLIKRCFKALDKKQ